MMRQAKQNAAAADDDDLRHRLEATQDQVQLRALHGFLRCPDARFNGLSTDDDYLSMYDPVPERQYLRRDFMTVNHWFCGAAPELVRRWRNASACIFVGEGKEDGFQQSGSAHEMLEFGVNAVYDVAFRRPGLEDILAQFFEKPFYRLVPELLSGRAIKTLLNLADDESLCSQWARCQVNIRPLPCSRPEDEGRKLEVQFLRFNDDDPLFMSGDSIYKAGGQLEGDGARAATASDETGASPRRICSGDVYVLETSDPENHPLPSRDVLVLQYHLHAIRHSLEAQATLQTLFGGPPPEEIGHPFSGSCRRADPSLDETLVEKAISEGIILQEDGPKWLAAFDFADWGRRLRKEAERMTGLRVIWPEVEEKYEEYEVDWEAYCDPYYVDDTRICPVII
ncbi:hypothetical protein PG984_011872 [Apiospora sp. TS-2023a]